METKNQDATKPETPTNHVDYAIQQVRRTIFDMHEQINEDMGRLQKRVQELELKSESLLHRAKRELREWKSRRELQKVLKSTVNFTKDLVSGKEKL